MLVDRGLDNFPVGQVFYNNRQGGYLATMELINNGHQNIGIMMNPDKNINCIYRYQGYLDALKEAQLPSKKAGGWSQNFSLKMPMTKQTSF